MAEKYFSGPDRSTVRKLASDFYLHSPVVVESVKYSINYAAQGSPQKWQAYVRYHTKDKEA